MLADFPIPISVTGVSQDQSPVERLAALNFPDGDFGTAAISSTGRAFLRHRSRGMIGPFVPTIGFRRLFLE
jgi:hypothetical protein